MRQVFPLAKEAAVNNKAEVGVKKKISDISDLRKKEDDVSIWLGFIMLFSGLLIYTLNTPDELTERIRVANSVLLSESRSAPFKTLAWYNALDEKKNLKATDSSIGKIIQNVTSKPHEWSGHLLDAFIYNPLKKREIGEKLRAAYDEAENEAMFALLSAKASENRALIQNFSDERLNQKAVDAIHAFRMAEKKATSLRKSVFFKPYNIIPSLLAVMVFCAFFLGIGMKFMGWDMGRFMVGFCAVFLIAVFAYTASANVTIKHYGIGYAAFAVLFGLMITHTIGTPKWVLSAVQPLFYFKTGLVLLGAEILLGKMLSIQMIQNGLIGMMALGVAIYWCAKVQYQPGQALKMAEIWHRCPKSVIGFLAASLLFSSLYHLMGSDLGYTVIDHGLIGGISKIFRDWFFCIAFVCIGLATDFRLLKQYFKGGKLFR